MWYINVFMMYDVCDFFPKYENNTNVSKDISTQYYNKNTCACDNKDFW